MKRLVAFISMLLCVPFLSAMNADRARRDFPQCMSVTQKGCTVYFSEGRAQGDLSITITPGMVKKTYVWSNARVKSKNNLTVAMAKRLIKDGVIQAVEFYFYEPSEVVNCVLRDSTSSKSSQSSHSQ